ncbi:hypothetical protein [Bacillus siamensis]|uniref:hypothetical protein n=1 Tax=Bacillus siamensis TaxID=659243 RepID=UPI0022311467|nr:hypothetical protein [Bacillus siamensis]UZD73111.1 hypothetical protein OM992_15110 [Bacillus siamensis]
MTTKKIIFDIMMYIVFGVVSVYLISQTNFGPDALICIIVVYLAVIGYKVKQLVSRDDS